MMYWAHFALFKVTGAVLSDVRHIYEVYSILYLNLLYSFSYLFSQYNGVTQAKSLVG